MSVHVSFGIPDKKFGPAEDEESRSARKILTITEQYGLPDGADPRKSIAQLVYDLEEETIKLKFHREKDRILCQAQLSIFCIGIEQNICIENFKGWSESYPHLTNCSMYNALSKLRLYKALRPQ